WSQAWIEQGGHQTIHLAHYSRALIGHPIGDDSHPHATTHRIVRMTWARWTHPGEHRAIGQSSLVVQMFPHPGFEGPQGMGSSLTHVLDKASRGDAGVHQYQHLWAHLLQQAVRPMHF